MRLVNVVFVNLKEQKWFRKLKFLICKTHNFCIVPFSLETLFTIISYTYFVNTVINNGVIWYE